MSINKLVSVNNVLINLLDSLSLDHTKYKPMFVRWAIDAEKQIHSPYQYKRKHKVLTIKNCCAELPCDAEILELALLGDYGTDCGDMFTRFMGGFFNAQVTTGNIDSVSFLVVDLPSSATAENGYFGFGLVNYHVQDNKVILDRCYDGQNLTIQYLGLEVDCDDIPLVGQNHLLALEEYCLWQFRRRNMKSGIDIGIARDHERLWREYAGSAKADDATPSASEQELAANMLHNPFSGRGLRLTPMDGYRAGIIY